MQKPQMSIALCRDQIEAIRAIQEAERKRSPVGLVPTFNAIARALVTKGLESMKQAQ